MLDELLPMVEIQEHRGPDHQGTMVDGSVALGMRRLAIIDLSTGNQPISNADNSISVICNGEIYNYLELRRDLIAKGYPFKTNTDTEVLVHLYSDQGVEMLQKLNGMFAFALWDKKKQTLLLARDRMGIKPLYYTKMGDRVLFASELKGLLTQENVDRTLSQNSISDYLRLGYIPRSATPYHSIHKLLPGHYLQITENQLTLVQWWDIKALHSKADIRSLNFDQETEQIFDESIKLRMRSDVPVASFLSGGLDSSLISVTASKMSSIPLSTYNVKFEDSMFDESPFAEMVAKHGGTEHHSIEVRSADILDKLPLLLWHMDEPIADSALIPNFQVSAFAREHVKVCLSGLGGDELFGGYSRYLDSPLGPYRKLLLKLPLLTRILLPLVKLFSPKYAARIAPMASEGEKWRSYLNLIEIFRPEDLKKLGLKELGETEKIISGLWRDYPGDDTIGQRQFIDQHTYLPDQILALTDRMSMAVSLEVRVPFLDHSLVARAAQLPGKEKQSENGEFKIWLKNKLGNRVPPEILNRKKWGFDAPVKKWIHSPHLKDIIPKLSSQLKDILDEEYVSKLILDKNDPRYHNLVWSLLVLAVWLKVHELPHPPTSSLTELFQ
ncbi:MAG: asparagine synthase (glutamine-hydrolyzing) [Candidatus Marinimicrobia bacterium]|nr:asparagine synthase (glutamine-hydrolyzing) [Candidatus Neomarinimicrobiota bacterium]